MYFFIFFTIAMFFFPKFFTQNWIIDEALDALGIIFIMKGSLLRMAGRGHKKLHSKGGHRLTTTGPYSLVRNPMYLGTYFIGVGFVLVLWPWWALIIFSIIFYWRFNKQIVLEEGYLSKQFGDEYQNYCRKVPRLFPAWQKLKKVKLREVCNLDECFATPASTALIGLPIAAVLFESLKDWLVFGGVDLLRTLVVFNLTILAFALVFTFRYVK